MKDMKDNDIFLDKKVLMTLLDIFSEHTGLSIVYYTGSREPIYSETNWPKFCHEIYKIIGPKKAGSLDFLSAQKGHYPCYHGLWCYAQPVKVGGNIVGTFVVGYRRIKGKEWESRMNLNKLLIKYKINTKEHVKIMGLLEEVEAVDENTFDIKLLENLSFINRFVTMEHQLLINEQERAFALKQESVSLAHEFLLPIQSIIADSENLFNESKEGSKLKDLAENVLQGVMKLSFIAENIRESVLGEQDMSKHVFQSVPIYPIIQDTVDLFQKEANKKGVVIKNPVIIGNPSPLIEMSKFHIKQLFFNLIHNAVKYSHTDTRRSGRSITIVCESCKFRYCIEISNYGVGILPDEISQGLIYDDGYRGILVRDSSRTGSGIGLNTVKRIVKMHDGSIEVESRLMGSDQMLDPYITTVKIRIPFTQPRRS